MSPSRRRALSLLLAMCLTAIATLLAEPTVRLADRGQKVDLEKMIPRQFGDWVMDERSRLGIVNPQGEDLVSRLYQQVLERTYITHGGRHMVMLSIAYGENQSHSHDLHVPDVCYPAGGYQIQWSARGMLSTGQGDIPVKRLVTQLHQRREPLTYWAIIGDKVATSAVAAKLSALAYGLRGQIPDGIIFRVSTIGIEDDAAFAVQQQFVKDLFDAIPGEARKRLANLS